MSRRNLSLFAGICLVSFLAGAQSPRNSGDIQALKQKAQAGDSEAQTELGIAYRDRDPSQAAEWFRKAAEQGNPRAQNSLGVLYHGGHGVPKDFNQAFGWYKKAAAQKYGPGVFNVAISYYNAEGAPDDPVTAYAWMLLAADLGEKEGQEAAARTAQEIGGRAAEGKLILAKMFEEGKDIPKDDAAAAKWYKQAADDGSAEGQVKYALMRAEGRGTAKDIGEAFQLLQRAAEQKSGPAMFAVGYAYQKGTLGQSVDIHEAAKWYERAAAAGNPAAMVNLGLMYADGTLGPPNYREAYFWLYMAEAFNIPQAKNSIPIITPHLSQKEIAGIEQSAGIWWQQKGTAILARRPEREAPQLVRADTSTPAHPIDLPPQDALPAGVFRIGGDVLPPKPIDTPDPKWDSVSRKRHTSGTIILRCIVGTDGRTRDIEVAQSLSPELDQQSIETLKQWKFAPATKQSQPVATIIKIEIHFNMYR
jgi:TonB family protein